MGDKTERIEPTPQALASFSEIPPWSLTLHLRPIAAASPEKHQSLALVGQVESTEETHFSKMNSIS